jgi:hypothetical protein
VALIIFSGILRSEDRGTGAGIEFREDIVVGNGICWIGSCRTGLGRGWIGVLACGLMLVAVSAQGAQDKKDNDKKKDDEKLVVKGSPVVGQFSAILWSASTNAI